MPPDQELIQRLIEKMQASSPKGIKAMIGFDGFVDEVVHVVEKRVDADTYVRMERMADYGTRIVSCAGLSMNVEMVPVQQKLGGNGPILANALLGCGMDVTYVGALGFPSPHAVFHELETRAKVISICDPGQTDAVEFLDGKIISSRLEPLKAVAADTLRERVGTEKLAQMIDESDFLGFENWTLVMNMTGVWDYLLSEVLPATKACAKKKLLLIDLCDPEKRSETDILAALTRLEGFSKHFRVVLGLNMREACELAELFGQHVPDYSKADPCAIAAYVKQNVCAETVVVHPTREACAVSDRGIARVDGPYCTKPRLTTGAGDNFNAGYALGRMLDFDEEESLLLGTASSGFYVRNCRSASFQELIGFLRSWNNATLDGSEKE